MTESDDGALELNESPQCRIDGCGEMCEYVGHPFFDWDTTCENHTREQLWKQEGVSIPSEDEVAKAVAEAREAANG